MRIYFVLFLSLFAFSCNQKSNKSENSLITRVVYCSVLENIPELYIPLQLVHYQNILYIPDYHGDKKIARFCLQSYSDQVRFGRHGSGPSEFIGPLEIAFLEDHLFIYDRRKFQLSKTYVNPDNYIDEDSMNLLFTTPPSVSRLIPLDKQRYLAAGFFPEGRYAVINNQGEIVGYVGEYPSFLKGEYSRPFDAKAMFHQVKFASNQQTQKVVSVSRHIIDILDFSDSNIVISQRIQLSDYDYEYESGQIVRATQKAGFAKGAESVSSTDSYFYVNFRPKVDKRGTKEYNEIRKYDWDGNLVEIIVPDCIVENILVIDEQTIYGIIYDPEPKLVRVDLSPEF